MSSITRTGPGTLDLGAKRLTYNPASKESEGLAISAAVSKTEMTLSEGLAWYYDLVSAGNDSIASYDYEQLEFMEDWRRDIKRVMVQT